MKFFKAFSLNTKAITIATALAASTFFGCSSNEGQAGAPSDFSETGFAATEQAAFEISNFSQNSATETMQTNPNPGNGGEKQVVLYDQGLQMPMSSMMIPNDWKLEQDIAIDPNTAMPARYKLDIAGPDGELIRNFAEYFGYGPANGKTFEQAYQEALNRVLQLNVQQISLGQLQRDPETEAQPAMQKMMQQHAQNGQQTTIWKVEFTASKNGRPYKGGISFAHLAQESAYVRIGVLWPMAVCVSPADRFANLEKVAKRMGETTKTNPAYEQRRAQIGQLAMQRQNARNRQRSANAQAAHQQRMQQRWNAYNSHQQNMQQNSQMQDQSFQNYMGNLRNDNFSAWDNSGGDYSTQDAYVDMIHERQTFDDPNSGFSQSLDGNYKYNFTDGQGNYYRTNDASFDYHSLPGNWQTIDPQTPNY